MRLFPWVLAFPLCLLACRGKLETLPDEGSSQSTSAATSTAPVELPTIELDAGPGEKEVQTKFGSCGAREWSGTLEVACFSMQEIELTVNAKGQPEKKSKNRKGDFARVRVDLAPTVLGVLADLNVPPVEKVYGGKQAAHLGDDASAMLKLDVGVTFKVEDRYSFLPGSVPPFNLLLSKAMGTLPTILELAKKPLLFPGETAEDAPPKAHSVLYIQAVPYFSAVSGETFLRSLSVVGPAARVRDADWVAVQESAFEDAGKTCGGYKVQSGPNKGETLELPLLCEKTTVVLRERRSGKTLSEKKFEAPKTCPSGYNFTQEKKVRAQLGNLAVETWLNAELKAKH